MSRAIIGTSVAVLILAGISALAQTSKPQEPPKSPELKVLNRFVGSWRVEFVAGQSNGDEVKFTETTVTKWSLQGQYIELRQTDSDGKQIGLSLYTYDSDAGVYKTWTFRSNSPEPLLTKMRWNESKKTFTGRVALGPGIRMLTTTRFIGNDRYEFTGTMMGDHANVLGEIKATAFRKK